MQSWMFLGSFERMRERMIERAGIVSMAHIGPRAFDAIGGEVVNVTAAVLHNAPLAGEGSYIRLVDIAGSEPKRAALLEAVRNPDCGWFHRADASTFHDIPGSPIAYWASEGLLTAFSTGQKVKDVCRPTAGIRTGDNEQFLRLWWEPSTSAFYNPSLGTDESNRNKARWFPCTKGGPFRKWYGNLEYALDWEDDGRRLRKFPGCDNAGTSYFFQLGCTWSTISSSKISLRLTPKGCAYEHCGSAMFSQDINALISCAALQNSSIGDQVHSILSPSLSFREASVGNFPLALPDNLDSIVKLATSNISYSKTDWDSQETSWGFKRNPLI